jgi:hypothetical protein
MNIVFVGAPFALIGGAGVVYNLFFNIEWNKMWAEGNWWLLFNTSYLMLMYTVGLLEAFEIPIFLHSFHVSRFVLNNFALFYNTVFIILMFEWYNMLYLTGDK